MLRSMLKLFKEKKLLSVEELSVMLKTDKSAIEGMLKYLVRRGYIKRLHLECNSCSLNCKTCPYAAQKDYYEYVGE